MRMSLATIAALGLAVSTSAHAASVNIKYDDLNLDTPQGQAKLDRRITKAARAICGIDQTTVESRVRDPEAVACVKKAKAKAHAQVASMIERSASGG